MEQFCHFEYGQHSILKLTDSFEFETQAQPIFKKNFELLSDFLKTQEEKGFKNYILTENPTQTQRLKEIFNEIKQKPSFETDKITLHGGFSDATLSVCVFNDHEIFERYYKPRLKQGFTKSESFTLNEITQLQPGDYVVHVDHGIGKYGGLEKTEINGKAHEVIKLIYKDNDALYISIHSLHRISKYKGKDGSEPKIYKLGSGAWQKLKETTKRKVKDIARELITLYAKRIASEGFSFSNDTYLQQELEASFIYEDTPDQLKATIAVKKAMESPYPMDMLVCGDVGFGKTEIAIRAAFKAVNDSKQVAVLVPTTILALQHFNTFKERLKDFPCNVDYISRLKSTSSIRQSLKDLSEGKTDIIIGTHKLIGNNIKFKDIGLLIIDEEQKFGVGAKEKLKQLKANVDTLTLTATPIPRTLQFSLMGARDLSIINTPPPNRHPIITELHTFNEAIIKEAIEYELSRKGQVFYIHNRVQNIKDVELMLNRICPGIKTISAHGQLEGEQLEKIMLDFIAGDYDVLVATSIIESGLDIPNANTIIINQAQNFGLSDLHQLRGRVGRSNKKAFCYLLAPALSTLTTEARRRLKAIEDFSELGSGFNISLQDLDIRGAGNLLGGEQSGFIADIGYETYQKILNEALEELKEDEFKDVYDSQQNAKDIQTISAKDCTIDTDLPALFPEEYIYNIAERTKLYRELDNISDEDQLHTFKLHLLDRFGKIPAAAEELLQIVSLRKLAKTMGIERIILKNDKMLIYFIGNPHSLFYKSETFTRILSQIQKNARLYKIKESKEKLSMVMEQIKSIQQAYLSLRKLNGEA